MKIASANDYYKSKSSFSNSKKTKNSSKWFLAVALLFLGILMLGSFTQQSRIKYYLGQKAEKIQKISDNRAQVLGENTTSKLNLSGKIYFYSPA